MESKIPKFGATLIGTRGSFIVSMVFYSEAFLSELLKDPSEVNRDPYEKAWIARLESSDLDPKEGLMNHHDYIQYVNSLKS